MENKPSPHSAPALLNDRTNAFIDDFNTRVQSISSTNPGEYKNSHALLLQWEGDQRFPSAEEILKQFEFTVEVSDIPNRNSQAYLQQKLSSFAEIQEQESTLLIVWYVGGGSFKKKRPEWTPLNFAGTEIDWFHLQRILEESRIDVVLILDCDYHTRSPANRDGEGDDPYQDQRTIRQFMGGRTELIAAPPTYYTHSNNSSPRNNTGSLTAAVIDKLEDLRGRSFTINQLYAAVCELIPSTVYRKLAGHDKRSIKIVSPIGLTRNRLVTLDIGLERRFSQTQGQEYEDIVSWMSHPPSGVASPYLHGLPASRMKLTASLEGPSKPQQIRWKDWLGTQAPFGVDSVSISLGGLVQATDSEANGSDLDGLGSLAATLNINSEISHASDKGGREYKKVSVLPVLWEYQDPKYGLEAEMTRICEVFRNHYGFHIYDTHRISMTRSVASLTARIVDLEKDHDSDEELVIVVYAGHGVDTTSEDRFDSRGDAIWTEYDVHRCKHEVNWSHCQKILFDAKCDVAIILNCCHAAFAALDQTPRGRNEILASSNRESETFTGDFSYLKRCSDLLESNAKQGVPFSLAEFHNDLDAQIKNIMKNWGTWGTVSSPYHAVYPHWNRSITLRPLKAGVVPVSSTGSTMVPRHLYLKFEIAPGTISEQTESEWQHWFTSGILPSQVLSVKFLTEAGIHGSG